MAAAMLVSSSDETETELERKIMETLKKEPTLSWAAEFSKCCGYSRPSPQLTQVLVSLLCFDNNHPSLWKFLDQGLSSSLLSPLHLLSLLTSTVIPHRRSQPEAYRLYLQLLSHYAFSSHDPISSASPSSKTQILQSIDGALQLSSTFGIGSLDPGTALVLFFFSIVTCLIDAVLADWGLQMPSLSEKDHKIMDAHLDSDHALEFSPRRDQLRRANTYFALEVLAKLTDCRKATFLLRLVHLNMPKLFNSLLQRLQFVETNKVRLENLNSANLPLEKVSANIYRILNFQYKINKHQASGILAGSGSYNPISSCYSESSQTACWAPFDIYMENAMDGKQLHVKSAIDVLTEIIHTLHVFNHASWQETFLALWLSALRLLQRERDPLEGPIPHLEARLSFLLSIVPLAISNILEEDAKMRTETRQGHGINKTCYFSKKHGLISSLQVLGQFSFLLCPPAAVVSAANDAAAKAVSFISTSKNENQGLGGSSYDTCVKAGGNMRHLIIEACIARNLIDTSAYLWPGYISTLVITKADASRAEMSPWSTFMKGSPLDGPFVDALIATPASSLSEIEKIYHIALHGSDKEKPAAAKILCGASLYRGWNIQEQVVNFVVKLLSPPISPERTDFGDNLVEYIPMLYSILSGLSSVDTVHILSLHGVIPEVAASLMPLCEAFGSLKPTSKLRGDEPPVYVVFSSAFLFLLRLWKFYRPPLEQCVTEGVSRSELSLEYLLLLHNHRIASNSDSDLYKGNGDMKQTERVSEKPIYIDYFPKLRAWYCQNRSCIASTLSGLSGGNPVHQIAHKVLSMIYQKINKDGNSSDHSPASNSSSPRDNANQRPMLPAWELLEAIPFVLEAMLTACEYGRLSSRDLTTGLRDLVDFLPASIAVILSYFSAEVTRGIWKPVPMNGKDWPSPAAMFQSLEIEMKEILAPVGVNVPCCFSGISPILLPLPMAALVSLTITFKLEKSLEYILAVVGPALENCASGCPWPSMPIIGCLWAQKIRRWHDFIVVSSSLSLFRQYKEAVALLLRSCFTAFLGLHNASAVSSFNLGGVSGLLGNTVSRHALAPGFLFLRSCRNIQNVHYVSDVMLRLVLEFAQDVAGRWASIEYPCLKSGRGSLSLATAKAKEVATLGASLLFVTGGSHLVQELYRETIPTWLLSSREEKIGKASSVSLIIEGYTVAYMLVLSGSLAWGVGPKSPSWAFSQRSRLLGVHMDFLARVFEGNISLRCDPVTWKSYVSCFIGLVVTTAPAWIRDVKLETLRSLASLLRGWHECELALSLLENGGIATIGSAVELFNTVP